MGVTKMSKYADFMTQADFYTTEARRHYHNPIKREIFKYLARQYEKKALKLTVKEAIR